MTWTESFDAIINERERQFSNWGDQHYSSHLDWHIIFAEEAGEVAKALCDLRFGRGDAGAVKKELIEALAVGIAWLEDWEKVTDLTILRTSAIW